MKYTTLRAFEKHLEGSAPTNFALIYMILGKDDGERRLAIDTLVTALRNAQKQGDLAFRVLQGDGMKADDLARELDTFSFFVKKEIVLINDADSMKKDAIDWLTTYFAKPNPHQTLILNAPAILHTTNYYKHAEKVGVVYEWAEEKPWEREKTLSEWATQEAASQSKKMSPTTALQFIRFTGQNRALLKQELDKLICYIGTRHEITPQDIQTMCTPSPSGDEWQLGEALMRLDPASAVKIIQNLLKDGASIFAILRQLRTQMQNGCQIAWILACGGGAEGVAKEFPYLKGRLLDQKVQLAHNYGLQRFKKGLQIIDEAEVSAKNGMDDHELLADMTIIKLTR